MRERARAREREREERERVRERESERDRERESQRERERERERESGTAGVKDWKGYGVRRPDRCRGAVRGGRAGDSGRGGAADMQT